MGHAARAPARLPARVAAPRPGWRPRPTEPLVPGALPVLLDSGCRRCARRPPPRWASAARPTPLLLPLGGGPGAGRGRAGDQPVARLRLAPALPEAGAPRAGRGARGGGRGHHGALLGAVGPGLLRVAERLHGRDGRRGLLAELRGPLRPRRAEARVLMSEIESARWARALGGGGLGERVGLRLCEPAAAPSEDADESAYAPELRMTPEVRELPRGSRCARAAGGARGAGGLHKLLTVRVPEVPARARGAPAGAGARGWRAPSPRLQELTTLARSCADEPARGAATRPARCPGGSGWSVLAQPVDVSAYVSRDFAAQQAGAGAHLGHAEHGPGGRTCCAGWGSRAQRARAPPAAASAPPPSICASRRWWCW